MASPLGGSISAEHGIGALKAHWLPLARTAQERALFARIPGGVRPGWQQPTRTVLPRDEEKAVSVPLR